MVNMKRILLGFVAVAFFASPVMVQAIEQGRPAVIRVQTCKAIDGETVTGCEDGIVVGLPYLLVFGSGFTDKSRITVADQDGVYPQSFSSTQLLARVPSGDYTKEFSSVAVSVQNGTLSSDITNVGIKCPPDKANLCVKDSVIPSATLTPSRTPTPSGGTKDAAPSGLPGVESDLKGECAKQGLQYDPPSGLCLPPNPYKANANSLAGQVTLGGLIKRVLDILLTLAGVIAVLMIVIGGYQYVTSQGADDKAKAGRKTVTNAAIGLIAVLLAYMLVTVVTNFVTQGTIF